MVASSQDLTWADKVADWGWGLLTAILLTVIGWGAKWKWKTDKDISDLRLHVSDHYVKKTDLNALKAEIAADFKEVKDGQGQIIDLLLNQKIGTLRRR